jgi:tetratricopeptide (TPR) repeat protein
MVTFPRSAGLALLALATAYVPPLSAQDGLDTAFAAHAARRAREKLGQLAGAVPAQGDARAAGPYREALAEIERGSFRDAAVTLEAAIQRARANPLYRGDLAYVYARLGRFDDAENSYLQARQLLEQNNWYLVGLAAVRAAQAELEGRRLAQLPEGSAERRLADSTARAEWGAAAGTLQFAIQADSSLLDGPVAIAATTYYMRSGYRAQAAEAAVIAVRLVPDFAEGWRIISEVDSVSGLDAARRYHALRPDDPRGQAFLAIHLINVGKTDSAMIFATQAASDSLFRPVAAEIFLVAGVGRLRASDIDLALDLLARGRAWATPQQEPQFAFYIGWAQLRKMPSVLSDAEEQRSCAAAQRADTLAGEAERNLRTGMPVDTARARQFLEIVIPQYHRNAETFAQQFCRPAQPARPQQRPAQQPRPRP